MFAFSLHRKEGLPQSCINFHDALLKNFIHYFEAEKDCRKGIRKARKSFKKSFRLARKRKINPGVSIREAREVLETLRDDVVMTRKTLLAVSTNLENALNHIQEERIDQPLSLINNAGELFRKKEIEKGLELLKQSQSQFEKKVLVNTRTALFAGTSNDITEMKEQIGIWWDKRLQERKR